VVVLRTAWDAEAELEAFATAAGGWIEGAGVTAEVIPVRRRLVDVVFASDAATLEAVVGPR
jgi:hypothetical protein